MKCPLCFHPITDFFHFDRFRSYLRCKNCLLIFVEANQLPKPEEEKARYLLHFNDSDDQGYTRFLRSFIESLQKRIAKSAKGLDYGSGPTPALAILLKKDGYKIATYDPFFADDGDVLSAQYDYLTCVETAEHFHLPRSDWETMIKLVKKGGWIGVKTSMFHEQINFSSWYYKRDFTHVCFYSKATFNWIGKKYSLIPYFEDESTVFFQLMQ